MSVSAAMREISIHAPAKGATARRRMMCRCVSNFNPRSREGSDAPCSSDRQSAFLFQSTLPRRERPDRAKSYNVPLEFQSTLPRRERPGYVFRILHSSGISIHAPVKGATDFLCWTKSSHTNFNPRSREGSDQTVALVIGNYTNFNPRSREGSDTRFLLLMLKNC